MTATDWIMIVVGVVALFAGYGFGWVEWGRKLKQLEEENRLSKTKETRLVEPVMPPARQEVPSLLALRETMGRLRLELDGQVLDANAISAEQRKRLVDVISRLRPWIDSRPAPPETFTPVPAPQPVPVVAPSPTRPTAPVPLSKKDEVLAPLSMVAQIDEILQQRIMGTPLAEKGIKLMETPGGGVTVLVGLNRYAGVGEVSDPEVQAAIRAAIAAWEKKFTPG